MSSRGRGMGWCVGFEGSGRRCYVQDAADGGGVVRFRLGVGSPMRACTAGRDEWGLEEVLKMAGSVRWWEPQGRRHGGGLGGFLVGFFGGR